MLNILREKLSLNNNFFDNIISQYYDRIGFEAELLLGKVSLLMEVVFANESQATQELKDMIQQIEFSGNVHYKFIARFLNKYVNLTVGTEVRKHHRKDGKIHPSLNIHSEGRMMERCLDYFDKWK
jgi:hypothetical protein